MISCSYEEIPLLLQTAGDGCLVRTEQERRTEAKVLPRGKLLNDSRQIRRATVGSATAAQNTAWACQSDRCCLIFRSHARWMVIGSGSLDFLEPAHTTAAISPIPGPTDEMQLTNRPSFAVPGL
ncbi:hypothetical protein AOLI_G00066530 [Acnodon oligacanthus]